MHSWADRGTRHFQGRQPRRSGNASLLGKLAPGVDLSLSDFVLILRSPQTLLPLEKWAEGLSGPAGQMHP